MTVTRGVMVVGEDMAIKGNIRNCQRIEVAGYVEGEITAGTLVIREGGRVFGKVRAELAEVNGLLQGNAFVKSLMTIGRVGSVNGNVQYGQLSMELGADLSADVRNVPPEIFGDLELTVEAGRSVAVTVADLTAVDPDDKSVALHYTVTSPSGGVVTLAEEPATSFSQADLEAGRVAFRHDGSAARMASFEVIVADASGATSGAPRKVMVNVR